MADDEMDEILDAYSSKSDVRQAISDKEDPEDGPVDLGIQVKDYPKTQREIDLHGYTGKEAMMELDRFIERCIVQRVLTVRVITGKGLHSKNFKSVIPEKTEMKLGELRRAGKVLTFKREKDGGAFVVYLIS